MKQRQFLEVLDRDEAERRWHAAIDLARLPAETVDLAEALGRVLAEDVRAEVDVPGFDRSNMDGFALRAEDTFGATEHAPARLRRNEESIPTGVAPRVEVMPGTATPIATGGMLPRGADAVIPIEDTDLEDDGAFVQVRRSTVPGGAVSFAGTDMGRGETVLFAGTLLTPRETGVLAAIGRARIPLVRRPRVAIVSTGDEIVAPGTPIAPGLVYDSNARILADAVRELGAEPVRVTCVRDDETALRDELARARDAADLVVLSGGTSKGEGDLCARVVGSLAPGILVHGVALKPGKPICLAADGRQPVVVLPGFPTSAVFTFHEFVAPVLRRLGGLAAERHATVSARLALRVVSERGRLEYLLVGLTQSADGTLAAYPMGKGSGSVTAFSRADGFVRIERNVEIVEEGARVEVQRIGRDQPLADLIVIGSHCAGLDLLASELAREGIRVRLMAVGSQAGLAAALRGECDLAPIHLFDPASGRYNTPFLTAELELLPGYGRMQGVATRASETREIEALLEDPALRMVNRNRGSGTRVVIDALLAGRRPPGFAHEPRSHYAVAAAIAQSRADWGVTIETVARESGLRFLPLRAEQYDFVVPKSRFDRPAVRAFRHLLTANGPTRRRLEALGFSSPRKDDG